MKIINLTPHVIRVRSDESNVAEPVESDFLIQPVSPAARLTTNSVVVREVDGIPVVRSAFGEVYNLPDPEEDTVYIVSMPVAQYAASVGRDDVMSPNTAPGQDIRYPDGPDKGRTFAVRGFQQF